VKTKNSFVHEPLRPVTAGCDPLPMAQGAPGLPRKFVRGGRTVTVVGVLRSWRETGGCRHGSGERYVRKHWFEIGTADGQIMKIYFDRAPRGKRSLPRWWLVGVRSAAGPDEPRGEKTGDVPGSNPAAP